MFPWSFLKRRRAIYLKVMAQAIIEHISLSLTNPQFKGMRFVCCEVHQIRHTNYGGIKLKEVLNS